MPRLLLLALASALILAAPASATETGHGYFKTRDGTELRYSFEHPDGKGPFPVLVNYEGYAAGTDPEDNGVATYAPRLLDRGYAILGVSVRGTGCSAGEFDPFDLTMGRDGYDAIEFAARQPWSDGRVGMIGVSFGGITQLLTAATRPPHLRAIAASSSLSDLYRDVAYPGGVLEYDFPFAWTAVQKEGGTQELATSAVPQGDAKCAANYAAHEAVNDTQHLIPKLILDHPFVDDEGSLWAKRSPMAGYDTVEVPALLVNSWQDEQLPGRIFDNLELFAHPDRVWFDGSNGNHGRDLYSPTAQQETLDFLDRFVLGRPTGFAQRPHLRIGIETAIERNGKGNEPAWTITRRRLVPRHAVEPRAYYLRAGGKLEREPARGAEAGDTYTYPLPSSDVAEPGPAEGGMQTGQFAFKAPPAPGGFAAFTSAPVKQDLVVLGPASLDLWTTTTLSDFDVQATLTEVRPDGQETYVQRGWLRASHRKLDPARSTSLRPYQTHLRGDSEPVPAGKPMPMRVEVFPFAHAFRAGSRLRLYVDAPTGHTGFWAFAPTGGAGQITVLHDAAHPSRLVLGRLRDEVSHAPLPACDTLRNQPCRPDPL
jgi:putative CocE/NonD family hydrolase